MLITDFSEISITKEDHLHTLTKTSQGVHLYQVLYLAYWDFVCVWWVCVCVCVCVFFVRESV